MKHLTAATAGHVDHGKSALIKALTGIDPDRLPEEKARGITIDLGFAHLDLATPAGPCSLGWVDVPGHEDFVKNMVAGVGSVDLAVLTVAADDGWMPQTEEHLQILTYLGVHRGVVALTKADLAGSQVARVKEEVRRRLAGTALADVPIVATSVVTGQGLDELRGMLAEQLAKLSPPREVGKPRLPVDRVFTLRGVGTVVTGTLIGGSLERGQSVLIQPRGNVARIRSIQCHGSDMVCSVPGRRTAINLAELAGPQTVERGDVITVAACGEPSRAVHIKISISRRGERTPPLKAGTRLKVHHGSGHAAARVFLLEGSELGPGEETLAELRLESPLLIFGGDRLLLRDWAEQRTLAGGLVLDVRAQPRRFRSAAQRQLLSRRAEAVNEVTVWIESEVEREKMLPIAGLLAQSRFGPEEIAAGLTKLEAEGRVTRAGDWVVTGHWWRERQAGLCAAVDRFHAQRPELPGLPLGEVPGTDLPSRAVLDLLIDSLADRGYLRVKTHLRHATHRLQLPPQLVGAGQRIRTRLSAQPMEPPSRKELVEDERGQQALRFLVETGEVMQIGEEVVLLTEAYAEMERRILRSLRNGAATVSELRQQVGTTRRILVPVLEQMDRTGLTRRQGDRRRPGPRAQERPA